MAVIKHRPRVRVRAPGFVHPGESFVAEIDVDCKRELDINEITAVFQGTEQASIGSGKSRRSRSMRVAQLGARVTGKGKLPEGRSSYRVRFELPAGAPPSYEGFAASTRYELTVRVDIPWWPDRKSAFQITVKHKPAPGDEGKPVVFTTAQGASDFSRPYLEASLATDVLAPGETLNGTFALLNPPERASVEVRVVGAQKRIVGSSTAVTDQFRSRNAHEVTPRGGGAQQTFKIPLGNDVLPTTHSVLWHLDWHVEVRARIPWARDPVLRIPFTVIPPRTGPRKSRRPVAPPSTGSDRVRRVWQTAAEETGMRLEEDDVLRGERNGMTLEIQRNLSGVPLLAGRLEMKTPLGIGLQVEPGGRIAGLFSSGFVARDDDWSRSYVVRCRERAQAEPLVDKPMLRAYRAFRKLSLTDEAFRAERREAGTNLRKLVHFIRDMERVAESLSRAAAAIPPPESMAPALAGWEGLATHLRGDLEPGAMIVRGEFDGHQASVVTRWGDEPPPLDTVVSLRPDPPVGAEHALAVNSSATAVARWLRESAGGALASSEEDDSGSGELTPPDEKLLDALSRDLTRYSAPARLALADLLGETRSATVGPEGITLHLPAPLPKPAEAVEKMEEAMRLVMALRGAASPYR